MINNKVHLYYAEFGALISKLETYQRYLSEDELTRAGRFHFPLDKNNFILARGRLRELLGEHLTIPAAQINFTYNKHGKPEVSQAIQFNLSHTKQAFLIAITKEHAIGVDIENMDRKVDLDGVAKQVFSSEEIAYIQAADDKTQAFYRCWTRKEAYVKALGTGIAAENLTSLTITPKPEVQNVQLFDLPMQNNHAMALAVLAKKDYVLCLMLGI